MHERKVLKVAALLALAPTIACVAARPVVRDDAGSAEVVVVGAGLTGLVAAYELTKAGVNVLVLEQDERIGGRVQTVEWPSGARAEAHMEEFWERSPAVPLLSELGLISIERDGDAAHSSVRIAGRIHPYTGDGERDAYLGGVFTAQERDAFLRFNATARSAWERLASTHHAGLPLDPSLEPLMQVTFKDWVLSQNLPHNVSEWIRVTVEPEIAVEWDRISALDGIDEFRIFLDGAERFGERNYHVPGGNARFVAALVERIGRENIVTSARVTAISQDADGVTVRLLHQQQRFQTLRAQAVIVTPPLFALNRIQFLPRLPEEVQTGIRTARFGSYVKVLIGITRAGLELTKLDGKETLVLLSDSPAGSIYDSTTYGLPEDADGMVTLLIHGEQAKAYCALSADEVRESTFSALDALFPGIRPHLKDAEVFTYPQAVAYWPVAEGRSRFDATAAALRRPIGRMLIGGDTTENSHSEGAVIAGQRMAVQALKLLRGAASEDAEKLPGRLLLP